MSVFSRATFSAVGYAASRPTYPSSLFKLLLSFHGGHGSEGTLVDLGCGHGPISRELSPRFNKVIGLDPSPGMLKQARKTTQNPKITFREGRAEDLGFLEDASVDMVVAGQAAHWYDYSKVWPELRRVVKPGGTLGFFGYKDNVIVGHRRANEILDKFCYAAGEVLPGVEGMAKYWEQPGRDRVRNLLRDVVPPSPDWTHVERKLYDVDETLSVLPNEETAWLRKQTNLGGLEGYLRTFSSYTGWRDAHPDVKSRAEGGQGDIVDLLLDELVASEPEWKAAGQSWRDQDITMVWGTYVLLARRR